MKVDTRNIFSAIFYCGIFFGASVSWALPSITIASLPWNDETVGIVALKRTVNFLKQELSGKYDLKFIELNADELKNAISNDKIDYFISNSLFYTTVSASSGGQTASRIAVLWNPRSSSPTYGSGGAIVVRKDSSLSSLEDLEGKRVALTSANDFLPYWAVLKEITDNTGKDAKKYFASLAYSRGLPRDVIKKVESGEADSGIIPVCFLEQYGHLWSADAIKVIAQKRAPELSCQTSTDLYLGPIFASTAEANPYLNRLILKVLLEMPAEDGFIWTAGGNLSKSHTLLQALNAEQYSVLSQRVFFRKIREHADVISILALILMGLIAHYFRSRYLIEKKTGELKEIQRTFNETTLKLDKMQKVGVVGLMSSMIAHELKQPIAIIHNYIQGLKFQIKSGNVDTSSVAKALEQIEVQTQRANTIIQRVRSYARQEQPQVRRVDLKEQINEAIVYLMQTDSVKIKIQVSMPVQDVLILCDPTDSQLAIYNLLKNAAEACKEQKNPEISVELETGHRVSVLISDNGPELTEETLENFGKLFKTTKKHGLGLGLAIVNKIAEANGGRLEFYKDKKGRTTAKLTFSKYQEKDKE